MNLIHAIILGVIQGLTEFLPISSTAHLIIIPWLLHWDTPGLMFDTSVHLGTLIAVLIYFKKDIWELIRGFFTTFTKKRDYKNQYQRLSWLIFIGIIPAGICGVLFEDKVETVLRSPYVIVFTLITLAIILFIADRFGKKSREIEKLNLYDSLIIGFCQAIALIPGVSRSGITMTAGLFVNLSRTASARFSFLLGAPIIAAGGIFELKDILKLTLTPDMIYYFILGFLSSGISGYLCIKFLLRYLQNNSFNIFIFYRILLGIFILITSITLKM